MLTIRMAALCALVATPLFASVPAGIPLHFERAPGSEGFVARGAGYAFGVRSHEAIAVLEGLTLHLELAGARKTALTGEALLPGKSHYLIGNDPAQWRTNVAQYRKVAARDIYDGIDLVYYGNGRQLEYDFIVKPGADPSPIRLDIRGGESIEIDANGDLVIQVARGELRQLAPVAYQVIDGTRRVVPAAYERVSGGFAVRLGSYDTRETLVIDPVLVYSTYLGGSLIDVPRGVAVDSTGSAYVTGSTNSTNFPTANPLQAASGGGTDAFVTKINAAGTALVYSTYIGGSTTDAAVDIALDSTGAAYVVGSTSSTNFPIANAIQATPGGFSDVFVLKLNATGSALVYSTYVGGSFIDTASSVAIDATGNAYVAGATRSTNFPTANALQGAFSGTEDAFVFKLNAAGSAFSYSTYLGGSGVDFARGIDVDSGGNAAVTGLTESTNFPTANAVQPVQGGLTDAFVTKLNAAGSAFLYSTYLGGSGFDTANAIAVEDGGNATVVGESASANYPTANALQAALGGSTDGVVTRLNASGSALIFSTYLGGTLNDAVDGVALEETGAAILTGATNSTNFPVVDPIQPALAGSNDAFVARLNPAGDTLLFSTYLGGTASDEGFAAATDSSSAYAVGRTSSTNFPTVNAVQGASGGSQDGWVARISLAGITVTPTSGLTTTEGGGTAQFTVVLHSKPTGDVTIPLESSRTDKGTVPANVVFTSTNYSTPQVVTVTGVDNAVLDGDVAYTILVGPATSTDSAYHLIDPPDVSVTSIDNEGGPADLAIVKTLTTPPPFLAGSDLTYSIVVTNGGPSAATLVTVTDVIPAGTILVSATSTQGSCSGSATVTCALGTIPNGDAVTLTLVVRTSSIPMTVSNSASVNGAESDPAGTNNTSAAAAIATVAPALSPIPTLSTMLLMLFGTMIAAAAMMKLRG